MTEFNVDDPRLTAFALGELDESESNAIERQLQSDAALRRHVAEIRALAGALQSELRAEAAPRLTSAQRAMIEREPTNVLNSPLIFRTSARWIAAGTALAACVALAVTAFVALNPGAQDESPLVIRELDQHDGKSEERVEKFALTQDKLTADQAEQASQPRAVSESPAPARQIEAESRQNLRGLDASAARSRDSSLSKEVSQSGTAGRGARAVAPNDVEESRRPASKAEPASEPGSDLGMFVGGAKGAPGRDEANLDLDRADVAGEGLAFIEENPFKLAMDEPLSTFSIDVDTASYANVRRFINQGALPPRDAVRIEEMVNYFDYRYEPPSVADGNAPFSANVEVNIAPWNPANRLVRVGLKGKQVKLDMRPPTSLVFLIDVSGSMHQAQKLPLVKESLKLLVEQLNADDRLAIVTYAGQAGVALDSQFVNHDNRERILQTIDSLHAGGSTNGAGGIQVAYDTAVRSFIQGGVNRVILCTDGDFNVGVASESELVQLIEKQRDSGVFLSVLGFGGGNFQEAKMQQLAKHGNGNFAYIDSLDEGRKVLVEEMGGTLITIAKDVKVQVDFNPAKVGAYRLIGYENRMLAAQDFANDKKDAGEIGAGHTVTALYEIAPPNSDDHEKMAAAPPRSDFTRPLELVESELLLNLKIRYKQPDDEQSAELVFPIADESASWNRVSPDYKFAAAVAAFGMVLRDSPHKGDATFDSVLATAREGLNQFNAMKDDGDSSSEPELRRRIEFIELVEKAKAIAQNRAE